jgi:glycosyltransferase involved in cell wall biosynthesis
MSALSGATPKVLYILPRYNANSVEHTYHLYGFLQKLQSRLPLKVIVETLSGPSPEGLSLQPLRIRQPLFRFFEELFRLMLAGLRGTRIFYVHYSYTAGIAAAIASRLTGGRSYYWNCGLYAQFTPPRGAPLQQRLREWGNRYLLEKCARWNTRLVTGTPRMAEYYSRHACVPRARICVLPNFVDADRFQLPGRKQARALLGIPEDETMLLFLHRVAPRKGAHYLPALAARLAAETGPLRLIVAGDGPYLPVLRRRAQRESGGASFDFRGWVPNREVPQYFHAADLFLMPSEEEGFPRVLLEAMAAGCPFVAFDVGGVRDILSAEQADCIALAQDVEDFTERCINALRDPEVRKRWTHAGKRHAAVFSEEKVLAAFLGMIAGEQLDWEKFVAAGDAA